jgi:hypothetical protein
MRRAASEALPSSLILLFLTILVAAPVFGLAAPMPPLTSWDIGLDLESATADLVHKAPYLMFAGSNAEMKVLWQLTSTATCTIEWGADTLYSLGNVQTYEYGSDHQHAFTITNLMPSAKYYYRVTAGTSALKGSFRAAPPSDVADAKFIVYGDTRSYPADHDQVAGSIVSSYVADSSFQSLIVSVGDLVNNGDLESDWDTQFFATGYPHIQEMLANIPYQAAMGNHEKSGVLFSKYFPYPFVGGRYWSFDYGPAHFVVDQYASYGPGSPQLAWVENDLFSTTKRWKFMIMHEPGWSAGGHPNNISVQNYLQPLCEEYGVAILFAGHNHYYARAEVNGVQHVTTGGGGAPLTPPDTTYPNVVTATMALHYCKVEIDSDSLHVTALTPVGQVIDEFAVVLSDPIGTKPVPEVAWFGLLENYPNPFNPVTRLEFSLEESAPVSMRIYDISGKLVRTLLEGTMSFGRHSVFWNGEDEHGASVASGIYVCRLEAQGKTATRKMVVLR